MRPSKTTEFTSTEQKSSSDLSKCHANFKTNITREYKKLLTKPLRIVARICIKETAAKLHAYSFIEKKGLLNEYIES